MKQFMVLICILPMLLLFLMQFVLLETNRTKTSAAEYIISASVEQARQDGCFTEENRRELLRSLTDLLHIDEKQIVLDVDTEANRKYRISNVPNTAEIKRGLIHYSIAVPIGPFAAGLSFLGITGIDNTYYYKVESYAASELIYR